MSNRIQKPTKNDPNLKIEDMPLCPELIDHCAEQLGGDLAQNQSAERPRAAPSPIFPTKTTNKNKKSKYGEGFEMCSKYHYCHEDPQHLNQQQNDFSIPSILLGQQLPIQIDIRPAKMIDIIEDTDKLVEGNLRRHKESAKQKKENQQKQAEEKKNKLLQLARKTKEKIEHCPKRKLSEQKREKWGHTIYNDKKPDENQDRQRDRSQSQKKQTVRKISLKPVDQRIRQYQNKHKENIQKQQRDTECRHVHLNPDKTQEQKQLSIQKNAEQILRQKRQKARKDEEKKKMIEGKIRAIQIQSIEGLKKFKKKPVDPTIDFIVDLPEKPQKKKKEKGKKQRESKRDIQADPQYRQKNFLKRDTSKSSLWSKTQKSGKSGSQSQKNKTQNSQRVSQAEQKQEIQEIDSRPGANKFYVWDVPITHEDLTVFDLPSSPKPSRNRQKKSFREEVDQYLQKKLHRDMQKYNEEAKMNKFDQMVAEKKKQLMEGYDQVQYEEQVRNQFGEVFWNQDILFKGSKIANFGYGS